MEAPAIDTPSATPSSTKRYRVTYKKIPGTLYLTSTTLSWNADVRGQEVVRVQQLSRIQGMFQSKAGAPRTTIKITFVDDVPAGGLTFVFMGEQAKGLQANPEVDRVEAALADRAEVVGILTKVIAQNNERRAAAAAAGRVDQADEEASSTATPSAAPSPSASGAAVRGAPADGATPPPAKRQKVASASRSTTPVAGASSGSSSGISKNVYDLRRAVLLKHPDLKKLYIEVVLKQEGKVLTEEEFWSGRQHLVQQEALIQSQQPGRSSQLLDDRFGFSSSSGSKTNQASGGTGLGVAAGKPKVDDSTGPKTMALSQELIQEIFEEFPIVQKIYVENVGGENGLTETEFWQRYFNSTLWDRHRASTRTHSTSAGTREEREKHDDVFDKYLEDPDDDLEPKSAPKRSVDMFLDLAATQEDHVETGNINDYTMQAGKQRSTLPLIRRFNEHSNRLVARDEALDALEGRGDATDRLYSEIELDDLRAPQKEVTYALDVQERQDKFNTAKGKQEDELKAYAAGKSVEELREVISQGRATLVAWEPNLPSLVARLPDDHPGAVRGPAPQSVSGPNSTPEGYARCKKLAQEAIRSVTDAIVEANDASAEKAPIPEHIMNQVLSCHNAACEFLRQFWSAVLPNLPGTLGAPTAQQKADKARKMADYLGKTGEKVEAVVRTAVSSGMSEPERVREALAPTLFAVEKAIAHYAASSAKKS